MLFFYNSVMARFWLLMQVLIRFICMLSMDIFSAIWTFCNKRTDYHIKMMMIDD